MNPEIKEPIYTGYEIVRCENGVGEWEIHPDFETFDTRAEAEARLQELKEATTFTGEQKELLLDLLTNHQHICEDDIQDEQYQKDLKLVLATKKVLGESNAPRR